MQQSDSFQIDDPAHGELKERPTGKAPATLYSLQYGRAFAALLVVYAHLSGFAQFSPFADSGIGGFGVDIFFVISGFIMWTTARDSAPGKFWLRRAIRVAPIYWLYTLLLVVLALSPGGLASNVHVTPESLLKSLLFFPYFNGTTGIQPLLLQGWTLNFEMYFYLVFGLALLLPRAIRLGFLLVFFGIAVALGQLNLSGNALYLTYTDSTVLEFVFGIVVAELLGRRPVGLRGAAALVAVSVLAFAVVSRFDIAELPRFLAYGVPSTLFIAGLVSLEPLVCRRPAREIVLMGDASYSLYLSHPFVLKSVAVIFGILGLGAADSVWIAILFGLSAIMLAVIFSILSYRLIERPLGRRLGKALAGRGGGAAHTPGGPQ